jgi:hypothetical protein
MLVSIFPPLQVLADACGQRFIKSHHSGKDVKINLFPKKISSGARADIQEAKLDLDSAVHFLKEKLKTSPSNETSFQAIQEYLYSLDDYYSLVKSHYNLETIKAQHKIYQEIIPHSNRIIEETKILLEKAGAKISIVENIIEGDLKFNYLKIDLNKQSNSPVIQKLQRYQNKFGVSEVSIDVFDNLLRGSGGVSEIGGRIDIGLAGVKNILSDEMITIVGKHEFSHAAFQAKRDQMQSSIYHQQYGSTGVNLTKDADMYATYFSTEEIYNYANNPFWGSTRFAKAQDYPVNMIVDDLSEIGGYLLDSQKIFKQGRDLAQEFSQHIEKLKIENLKHNFHLEFTNINGEPIRKFDEAYFLHINIKEQKYLLDFVAAEYVKDTKVIFKNKLAIEQEYNSKIKGITDKKQIQELKDNFLKEEAILNQKFYENILNQLESKQQSLNKISQQMLKEVEKVKKNHEKIAIKLYDNYELTSEITQELVALRQEYRRLGNLVKENYKGFVGN